MVIFHSYVSLPEGITKNIICQAPSGHARSKLFQESLQDSSTGRSTMMKPSIPAAEHSCSEARNKIWAYRDRKEPQQPQKYWAEQSYIQTWLLPLFVTKTSCANHLNHGFWSRNMLIFIFLSRIPRSALLAGFFTSSC